MGSAGQKTNRMNFLNGVFVGKQVFLRIISGNTSGRGERRIKLCCGPEIRMYKNNPSYGMGDTQKGANVVVGRS